MPDRHGGHRQQRHRRLQRHAAAQRGERHAGQPQQAERPLAVVEPGRPRSPPGCSRRWTGCRWSRPCARRWKPASCRAMSASARFSATVAGAARSGNAAVEHGAGPLDRRARAVGAHAERPAPAARRARRPKRGGRPPDVVHGRPVGVEPGDDHGHLRAGRAAAQVRHGGELAARHQGPGQQEVAERDLGPDRVGVQRRASPGRRRSTTGRRAARRAARRPAPAARPTACGRWVRSSTRVRVAATSPVGAPRSATIVVITRDRGAGDEQREHEPADRRGSRPAGCRRGAAPASSAGGPAGSRGPAAGRRPWSATGPAMTRPTMISEDAGEVGPELAVRASPGGRSRNQSSSATPATQRQQPVGPRRPRGDPPADARAARCAPGAARAAPRPPRPPARRAATSEHVDRRQREVGGEERLAGERDRCQRRPERGEQARSRRRCRRRRRRSTPRPRRP